MVVALVNFDNMTGIPIVEAMKAHVSAEEVFAVH